MESNPLTPNKITKTIKIKTISTRNTLTYITITLKSNNPNYKNGSITYTIGKIKTIKVEKPICNNLTYNGNSQTLVTENVAYRLFNNTKINYGTYKVRASLNYGYTWDDNTYEEIEFNCTIKRPTPTITYKNATCNPKTKVVTYEDTYGTLCNPTKTGYTFIGWYTDKNLTNKVDSSTIVTNFNNHNLYAKWQINKIYVKYNTNGGTVTGTNTAYTQSGDSVLRNGNIIVQTYNYGATEIDLNNYNSKDYLYITKIGYKGKQNKEWNTKKDGSGTSFSQTNGVRNASDLCDASKTDCTIQLYVNWETTKIYVKYNTNGGTITGTNTVYTQSDDDVLRNGNTIVQTYNYGATEIDLNNYNSKNYLYITKTGYNAKSKAQWNTKKDGTGKSYDQDAGIHDANELCDASITDCTAQLYVNWIDDISPTCSITYRTGESSWVTNGVDITVSCSDSGSGCKNASKNYEDVTSDKTYTVQDNAGNIGACSLDITSRTMYSKRTKLWGKYCYTCNADYAYCDPYMNIPTCNAEGQTWVTGRGCCSGWNTCKTQTWYNCYSSTWGYWSGYSHTSCTKSSVQECASRIEYKKNG